MERFQDRVEGKLEWTALLKISAAKRNRNGAVAIGNCGVSPGSFFFPSFLFSFKDGAISTCEYPDRNEPVKGEEG